MTEKTDQVNAGKTTIDYLCGIHDADDDIAEALKMTGLWGLPPNKPDYQQLLVEAMKAGSQADINELEKKAKQISDESIQYSLDLAKIYTHLFMSPDIQLKKTVRLPQTSGKYKFIIFADQSEHPLAKEHAELSGKIKKILPDIVLEADSVEYHKHIAKKRGIDNTLFIYGGGRIVLDTTKKTLHVYGKSMDYGRVSNALIHRMLEDLQTQGYQINVEMGEGY